MRIDVADLLFIILVGGFLYLVLRERQKTVVQEAGKRHIRHNAIRLWWSEAEARGASYRSIVNAVQSGNHDAVLLELAKVGFPANMLQLHPIIQTAAANSEDIRSVIDELVSSEDRFLNVAGICAERTGRPGLLESPAFRDLKELHFSVSSCYLSLREHLEEWVLRSR